jgi:flagellar hook-length control protein FliK
MGNSASLPSLESNGRPFGTERSPIFSLGRHIDGQTRTEGPVARLDRTPGAGGRRRARREEQESSQRDQNGKRPEQARSERNAQSDPSRRSTEAKARERNEAGNPIQGRSDRAGESTSESTQSSSTGQSFKSHLVTRELGPETPKAMATEGQTSATNPDHLGVPVPAVQTATPLPLKAAGSNTHNSSVGTGLGPQAGGAKMTGAPAGATPVLATVGNANEAKSKRAPSVPVAVSTPELSEAQEAQRTSQVLRQLRMQLHPGMRSATVHLNPAELGRLQIKIRTSAGEVKGVIHAETAETLAMLERHVPELEAAFADQGFDEMSFEFVLDQQESPGAGAWNLDRDVSAELESRLDKETTPGLRDRNLLSDLGVDTYA